MSVSVDSSREPKKTQSTNEGPLSATITVNFLWCAAALRYASTVLDLPIVRIISLDYSAALLNVQEKGVILFMLTLNEYDPSLPLINCRILFLARLRRLGLLQEVPVSDSVQKNLLNRLKPDDQWDGL